MSNEAYEKAKRALPELAGELDVTVSLTIRLHRNGAMSVEAPIGDPAFCFKLLDEARDAIKRQCGPDCQKLVVPGNDVDSKAKESYP